MAGAAVRGNATAIPTSTGGGVRYPDAAYDAVNNVFLAVTGKDKVQGRFLSAGGALLAGPLGGTFNLTSATGYQQAPRAHCGEGVCLVVWHEGDSGTTPMARLVSYTDGFLSSPFALGPKGSMWEMGAGIAYASAVNQFLVAWHGNYGSGNNIWIARVSTAGKLVNNLALTNTSAYEREPSVAYNAASGEFVVVYAGTTKVNGIETAYVRAQRVKDGAALGGPIQLDSAKASYISWAEYNPTTQSVLATWSRGGTRIYGRAISAAGSIGSLLTLSTSYGAYDALDVSYNPVTQSFLLVTHGSTVEDVGIELSSSYAPSPAFVLTANGGTGNFNPRVASSTASATWMAVTAKSFASLVAQYATGTAGSGGGGGGGGGGSASNPVQITSLTSNLTPPFVAGNAVTFTVGATGGTGTLQYAFWLQDPSNQWVLARSYSSSNTFTWTPQDVDAGTRNLQVWVRSSDSSADFDTWQALGAFKVTSPTPGIKSFAANRSFPSPIGTPITWTVDARGGTGPLEYAFYRYNNSSNTWTKVAEYSNDNTYTWTPPVSGTFLIQAWVRTVGSSADYQTYASTGNFIISGGTPDLISVTSNKSFPVSPGTPVTFAATSTGSGTREYAFWLYNQNSRTWTLARPYSTNNQFTWSAVLGTYNVQVWVRNVGSSADYQDWQNTPAFTVMNAPPKYLGMTWSVPLPAKANSAITFRIQASGSSPLEYQFWLYNAGTDTWKSLCGSYMSSNTCTWIAKAGTYRLQGWVRNQSSSSSYDDWGQTGTFQITN